MKNIEDIDSNLKIEKSEHSNLKKYNILQDKRFTMINLPFEDNGFRRTKSSYSDKLKKVNGNLVYLGTHTAGLGVTFKTNSTKIELEASLIHLSNMWHMASTGEAGFDLYLNIDGKLQFVNITRKKISETNFKINLFSSNEIKEREFVIYFPLYCGVSDVNIYLDNDAEVVKYSRFDDKKWVFYGTSITQGGCSSRPGLCYTNMLSRHYSKEIINLGFSGNGLGEIEIAEMINEMPNVELVLIDIDANACAVDTIEKNLEPFIKTLKEKKLKVILISRVKNYTILSDDKLIDKYAKCKQLEISMTKKYEDVYFIDGEVLFDDEDYSEFTVDGVHFNDLGFYKFSKNVIPYIDEIIKG